MNDTVTGIARRVGPARVMFIDGRSGSGKTTLAAEIAEGIRSATGEVADVLGMDSLYPGWGGLDAGSRAVAEVLGTGQYREYDWHAERFGEIVTLDRSRPLIIEGCGSLSAEALAVARAWGDTYAMWVSCPTEVRKERALGRDGDMFAPHWLAWAAQEVELFGRTQPIALANEVVHASTIVSAQGAPTGTR